MEVEKERRELIATALLAALLTRTAGRPEDPVGDAIRWADKLIEGLDSGTERPEVKGG